jgi:hypothetical protein
MVSSDPKPTALCDSLDRIARGGEQLAGGFDAHLLHCSRRRQSHRGTIVPLQAALTHAGAPGKNRHGKILPQMLGHPAMQAIEFAIAMLECQYGAELGLAAGTLQEDHQPARDRRSGHMANIFLDHGK